MGGGRGHRGGVGVFRLFGHCIHRHRWVLTRPTTGDGRCAGKNVDDSAQIQYRFTPNKKAIAGSQREADSNGAAGTRDHPPDSEAGGEEDAALRRVCCPICGRILGPGHRVQSDPVQVPRWRRALHVSPGDQGEPEPVSAWASSKPTFARAALVRLEACKRQATASCILGLN